jgi:hypothetical protein
VGSEYFINSQELEDKVRNLLPSQGGAGAGFDLSASTQIIPVIDLTESAEGSNLRQDLQTSLSHGSVTSFNVVNTTTTIISNTGYYRIFGALSAISPTSTDEVNISISDGATSKILINGKVSNRWSTAGTGQVISFDFVVFVPAGGSVTATSGGAGSLSVAGSTRQIADIDGELTNP